MEEEKKQLLNYIDASWDTNKIMIHEETTLANQNLMIWISHEINTPLGIALTSLSAMEHVLKNDYPDINDKIHELFHLSYSNTLRISELIEKLNDVSRVSLGEDKKSFNLKDLLKEIQKIKDLEWRSGLSPNDINQEIQQDIQCADTLVLQSYPYSLSVVLGLCLDNCYDSFTGQSGKISIICESHGKKITIMVQDSGPGIKPEHLENILDPFFTTSRSKKHMGLGLSIAHNLMVNLFGGDISVASTPGEGTSVIFSFPDVLDDMKVIL